MRGECLIQRLARRAARKAHAATRPFERDRERGVEQRFDDFARFVLVARLADAEIEFGETACNRVGYDGVDHDLARAAARGLRVAIVADEQTAEPFEGRATRQTPR